MDGNGNIGRDGFRTGSGNFDIFICVRKFVFYIIKFVGSFLIFYFQIGKRGLMLGAPIDRLFGAINQAVFIKFFKCFTDNFLISSSSVNFSLDQSQLAPSFLSWPSIYFLLAKVKSLISL